MPRSNFHHFLSGFWSVFRSGDAMADQFFGSPPKPICFRRRKPTQSRDPMSGFTKDQQAIAGDLAKVMTIYHTAIDRLRDES